MSQIVGNAALGYTGQRVGQGPNGGVCDFIGSADPNTLNDTGTPLTVGSPFTGTGRDTVNNCDLTSRYRSPVLNKVWYKTALSSPQGSGPGTWTQLTIP